MQSRWKVFKSDGVKDRLLIIRFVVTVGGKYAWQSLKNLVKFFLGRKSFFDDRMLFLRQYLLHLTGLRPIRGITVAEHWGIEGAASQAHWKMNAINFARASGLTYVHTPFTTISHADRPMPEWAAAWEALFNLGAGEAACDIGRHDIVNYSRNNRDDVELCFGWHRRKDQLTRSFKALIPEFRRKYYGNKSHRVTNEVTVAVHIRRGDVPAVNSYMLTRTEIILRIVSDVKSILDTYGVPYNIRVYSQGKAADFAEFAALGVEFFLDADPIWTIQELIEADILIMAKSNFSYYAGIVSDGIKIFEPQAISAAFDLATPSWQWTLLSSADNWLQCQTDGSIDRIAFERQLSILTQTKTKSGLRC